MLPKTMIIEALNDIAAQVHKCAVDRGWYEEGKNRNLGELNALIHSEVSELLEATREPDKKGHLDPDFSLEAEECADIIIRALDYARFRGIDIGAALMAKYEYNLTREHKHGGKLF